MIKKVIILGTGGNCLDILDTINDINEKEKKYECVGFLDDNESMWGKTLMGKKVLGPLKLAKDYDDCFFVNGIGSDRTFLFKKKIIDSTGVTLDKFETIIHPTASVSRTAKLGNGVVVFQNATITTNVEVGNHVIILPNSIVSHDSIVGDYCCITGGVAISGMVKIGEFCYVGTGSSIRNGVTVGKNSLIGMGSVVTKDIESDSVVYGAPAKFIRKT